MPSREMRMNPFDARGAWEHASLVRCIEASPMHARYPPKLVSGEAIPPPRPNGADILNAGVTKSPGS